MATEKLNAAQIVEALQATNGLPALAAERLGVSTKTIYNYRDRYQSVAEAMHHQKEKRKDFAEGKLWNRINAEDTTAIIFYLKTQAKDRGYVERQELTGADGGPVAHQDTTKLSDEDLARIAGTGRSGIAETA